MSEAMTDTMTGGSGYQITYSAELMDNFLQDDVLAADARFEALQTQGGASLLFSKGTDNVFYLTREVPGTLTGWSRADVSSALIADQFPGVAGAHCIDFVTAQHQAADVSQIHLAQIVTDGQDDHLFLSLGNDDADDAWASAPPWTRYPYDNPDHKLPQVKIVGTFLGEASDHEYVIVDVLRDPTSDQGLVSRFYIDPVAAAQPDGYAWHPHDLAIDLQSDQYTSCLGRRSGQGALDGLYTAGHVGGVAQLIYQPVYNPYDDSPNPAPAPISRFTLPDGGIAAAIAPCRNADDTSDLYLVSDDMLYYLGADNQMDGAVAVPLARNAMFAGVRKSLFAAPCDDDYGNGGGVIVWGLNGNGQVFYTTCTSGDPESGPWSVPLPLVSGAVQVAPYLDRVQNANTFFCHTGSNRLRKAMKSSDTGHWTMSDISLDPPHPAAPARSISSYTTRIRVLDADNQPVSGESVTIAGGNVSMVYINYLRYRIGPQPIEVQTDGDGSVTIVEPVTTLGGTRLTVTVGDGTQIAVNPMDKAFAKAMTLTSADDVAQARIVSPNGDSRPLSPSASADDRQAVADSNAALQNAYADGTLLAASFGSPVPTATAGGWDWLDPGDLIRSLVETAWDEVKVLADESGITKLIVTIGEQTLQCVLDTVESIVSSAWSIISAIVEAVEDVIAFLKFLFEWQDIARTQAVLKTMARTFLTWQVAQIPAIKEVLGDAVAGAEQLLAEVTGTDFAALGSGSPSSTSAGSPDQSAPGAMLSQHYQANSSNTAFVDDVAPLDPMSPADELATLLETEGEIIGTAFGQLTDLGDRMFTMPLPDILAELVDIIGVAVLESAEQIIDIALDTIGGALQSLVSVLDAKIYIPVVSDVLSFFGVDEFSYLDVVCWIGAIAGTLLCKVTQGEAPFPDSPTTTALRNAPDYASFLAVFGLTPPVFDLTQSAPALRASVSDDPPPPTPGQVGFTLAGHFTSGIASLLGARVNMDEADLPPNNPKGLPSAALAIIGGSAQGVAAAVANTVVPYEPIQDPLALIFNDICLGVHISVKAGGGLWGMCRPGTTVQTYPLKIATVTDFRGLMAFFDAFDAFCTFIPVIWHFVELSRRPESLERMVAITDEISTVTSLFSRMSYFVAVNQPMGTRNSAITAMAICDVGTCALQTVEAVTIAINET